MLTFPPTLHEPPLLPKEPLALAPNPTLGMAPWTGLTFPPVVIPFEPMFTVPVADPPHPEFPIGCVKVPVKLILVPWSPEPSPPPFPLSVPPVFEVVFPKLSSAFLAIIMQFLPVSFPDLCRFGYKLHPEFLWEHAFYKMQYISAGLLPEPSSPVFL